MKMSNKVKGKTLFVVGMILAIIMLNLNVAWGLVIAALTSLASFEIHGTKDKE
jgi:hypothetical protein